MAAGSRRLALEDPRFERAWIWSVVIRFWLAIVCLPGYIHPDEFFQSPEVMAADVLDVQAFVPWEFASVKQPLRSVFFPALVSGLPMWLLKWGTYAVKLISPKATLITPYTIVVAPRLMMFFGSLIIDFCIHRICRRIGLDPFTRLCILGSSYVTILFHSRPFSNSVESILFALALYFAVPSPIATFRFKSHRELLCLGGVFAAGLFNRPTFGLILIGVGLLVLWELIYSKAHVGDASHSFTSHIFSRDFLLQLYRVGFTLSLGFISVALAFIVIDSLYFGSIQVKWDTWRPGLFTLPLIDGDLTVTPWNFIKYNTNSTNLAEHGVHFRGTHLMLNCVLLFGPLYLLSMCVTVRKFVRVCAALLPEPVNSTLKKSVESPKGSKSSSAGYYSARMSRQMLLCGALFLAGLSLFPHQEPRFIIPLLLPLIISFGHCIAKSGPLTISIWLLFNIAMTLFYGVVHQGGVQRSLFDLQKAITQTDPSHLTLTATQIHVVYWYTYMPPRHILLTPAQQDVTVYDMGSASHSSISSLLQRLAKKEKVACDSQRRSQVKIYLVAPRSINRTPRKDFLQSFQIWKEYFPHFSAESPTGNNLADTLTLSVWERTIDTINIGGNQCLTPSVVSTGTN